MKFWGAVRFARLDYQQHWGLKYALDLGHVEGAIPSVGDAVVSRERELHHPGGSGLSASRFPLIIRTLPFDMVSRGFEEVSALLNQLANLGAAQIEVGVVIGGLTGSERSYEEPVEAPYPDVPFSQRAVRTRRSPLRAARSSTPLREAGLPLCRSIRSRRERQRNPGDPTPANSPPRPTTGRLCEEGR